MSHKKEIQIRKCVGTNERYPKSELLRIVRFNGVAIIDETGKLEGRGAYIKADISAIEKAKKKNAFAKALRMKVDSEIYDTLLESLNINEN